MHTAELVRRTGAGTAMLRHIIAAARACGMSRLSLETGSWDYFRPARALYQRNGFLECPPFGDYIPDPNSVFMTLSCAIRDPQQARSRHGEPQTLTLSSVWSSQIAAADWAECSRPDFRRP
jgi:ribosomal protein S18 acetylase RimI-like enzyme